MSFSRLARSWLIGVTGALAFLVVGSARANGRFPATQQIAFSPVDPQLVVVRTTFGILLSRDAGSTWNWFCEDVLGISSSSSDDPVIALTGSGAIVATSGSNPGMAVSADNGCTWVFAEAVAKEVVRDLVVRPNLPDTVLALTSTMDAHVGSDGGTGYVQRLYESTNDGADWAALGSLLEPDVIVSTVEVAPGDGDRIYVSAERGMAGMTTASLFVSIDHGESWTERSIPIDAAEESGVFIAAVDPTDADRVYVRTLGTGSRLLVTTDAGQTFTAPLTLQGPMRGFALSPDGSTIYAGSIEDGLFVATRDTLSFSNTSSIPVGCLATQGSNLWACSDETGGGFIVGVSTDGGRSFMPALHLMAQPTLVCPTSTVDDVCGGAPRQAICQRLRGCASDGGADADVSGSANTDASGAGGSGGPFGARGGAIGTGAMPAASAAPRAGGCSVASVRGARAAVFDTLAALAAAAGIHRRRRRKDRRSPRQS